MPEETVAATPAVQTAAVAEKKERSLRKVRIGIVTSDKMTNTIVVEVVRRVPHPKFKKIVKRTTHLYAHDEKSEAKIGDLVRVMETRPLSKLKRWRLLEILQK